MPATPAPPADRPTPRPGVGPLRGVGVLVAAALAVGTGYAAGTRLEPADPPRPAAHRSRTDVPREVPVVPGEQVPPARAGRGATRADLAAAQGVVWPLPTGCQDDPPRRATLPRGTGYSEDPASLGEGTRLRRSYGVVDGRLVPVDGAGEPDRCDQLRWRVLRSAIPDRHLPAMDQLVLYDHPQPPTGGVRTGFFEPNPADPTRYRLALATDLPPQEQLLTMAHEVGHVVSLYPERPRPRRDEDCPWVIDDAATCAAADSPLSDFFARTYDEGTRRRVAALYAGRRPTDDELGGLHRSSPGSYVTRYAATHPTEDLAESYAYWCLWGTSTRAPVEGASGSGLAKRAFFDQEAERGRVDARACSVLRGLAARR